MTPFMSGDSNRAPSSEVSRAARETGSGEPDGAPERRAAPPARRGGRTTLLVDAENVRRSRWPNLSKEELVDLVRTWAEAQGFDHLIVFDGAPPEQDPDLVAGIPTADDWLAEHAREYTPYWLVTSDRDLRERAGRDAERIVGGGGFLKELGVSR
jgi:hypothetical protein